MLKQILTLDKYYPELLHYHYKTRVLNMSQYIFTLIKLQLVTVKE